MTLTGINFLVRMYCLLLISGLTMHNRNFFVTSPNLSSTHIELEAGTKRGLVYLAQLGPT